MRPEWFSVQKELLPTTKTVTNPPTTANHADDTTPSADTLPNIPLKEMWADDEFWMPLLLARRRFIGRADFGPGNELRRWWFATVGMLE